MVIANIFLIGCTTKEKIDEAITPPDQNIEIGTTQSNGNMPLETETGGPNAMAQQANKEGVSTQALEEALDGLAQLTADKYGITKEDYIGQVRERGESLLGEWQLASENMGITITELYKYEKQRENTLTDDQKETMAGMGQALKMAESELENMPAPGTTDVENMLGIYGNDSDEIRVVTMDDDTLRQALTIDTYKILQDYTDEYSINYEYLTDASYETIKNHYVALVENTNEYLKLEPIEGKGIMLQGTVNETLLYIEVDNSDPGKIRVSTYLDLTSKN